MYRTYESFNKSNEIRDMAWLYFLVFIYDGKLEKKSWATDNRMGAILDDSMKRFEEQGLVEIDDEAYHSNKDAMRLVVKTFYKDKMEDAFTLSAELVPYDGDDLKGYNISGIPLELWIKFSNYVEDFDDWRDDFFVPWWNTHGEDRVLKRYIKNNKDFLSVINEYHLRRYYFPNELPAKITLYRGIKNEYDIKHSKGYTSWTLNEDQAKRFATYHFTTGYSVRGIESNKQTILEAEVNLDEIVMFVGGEEHEVILKEPIEVKMIRKIK